MILKKSADSKELSLRDNWFVELDFNELVRSFGMLGVFLFLKNSPSVPMERAYA